MKTEDEARKLWCPMMAQYRIEGDETDRHGKHDGVIAARCIASQCMAWRWAKRAFDRDTDLFSKATGKKVVSAWSDDAEWRPVGEDANKDAPAAHGFCGLAGKPS